MNSNLEQENTIDEQSNQRIPPKPLDTNKAGQSTDLHNQTTPMETPSFKSISLKPHANSRVNIKDMNMEVDDPLPNLDITEEDTCISLINEDKERIYMPWKFSVIIKVLRKKLNHAYLKKKLAIMWRLSEEVTLIDLAYEYYSIKLPKEENTQKIIQEGP